MSAGGSLSMQDAIEAGRAKYVAQRYKQALDAFTDAIKLCPCEIEKKKRKRSDSVGQELSQNAELNQAATSSPSLECTNPLHLQALNYRAGTFEKIPDLRRAHADARRMMDVAPCSPDGYLRAGKILRMEEKPKDSFQVLTDGIMVFLEQGAFEVEDLRRLDKARNPLKQRFAKVDPLGTFPSLSWMSKAHLPPELILDIFGRLEIPMLCQCLRVSKTWRNALTAPGSVQLWRSLIFTGASIPRKPITFNHLVLLLSYSRGSIKEFVVDDARKFHLDQRKFNAILNAGTGLERLELLGIFEPLELTRHPKHLKYLHLDGFHRFYRITDQFSGCYRSFLTAVLPTLETLIISGLRRPWSTDQDMPMMSNLRNLRLNSGTGQPWAFSIRSLLKKTPQLEQLSLEDNILCCDLPEGEEFDDCCVPNLKSLTIMDGGSQLLEGNDHLGHGSASILAAYRCVTSLNRGKKLKALTVSYRWQHTNPEQAAKDIFSHMYQENAYEYENMEVLRLSSLSMSPQLAERLFAASMRLGRLSSFDICFPLPRLDEAPGESSASHIQQYQWLEGAESIRCLGIYDFSFKTYVNASSHPLIKFLQKLPNLEEVKLSSSVSGDPEYLLTIEDVLRLVNLKSIEVTRISGEFFDRIRRLATKQGVKFTWEAQQPKWPYKI